MRRRKTGLLLVLALLPALLAGFAAPANATTGGAGAVVAQGNYTFAFNQPLTPLFCSVCQMTQTALANSSATQAWVRADTSRPFPVTESVGTYVDPFTWSHSSNYIGGCALATMGIDMWPGTGVLLGGAVMLEQPLSYGVSAFSAVYALVPNAVCNESRATATGVSYGAWADNPGL